jgi:hypothetical protein
VRRAALGVLGLSGLLAGGAAFAAEDVALRAVEDCSARLDPRLDVGLERVRRRCPGLLPALERAEWRGLLPASFGTRREDVSAEGLRALAALVRASRVAAPAAQPSPDPRTLAPVLAELGEKGQEGVTRWERFKRWLREKFESRERDEPGWLDRWARRTRTSEGVAELLTYAGYVLLAALVVAVIWAELRAASRPAGPRPSGAGASCSRTSWRRRSPSAPACCSGC